MKESNMTEKELYATYANWSGELHAWTRVHLKRHVDVEFFPDSYKFAIYSGSARGLMADSYHTVPTVVRPAGEAKVVIQLPKPKDDPTDAQLRVVFRDICLAAARVLEIDLKKPKLAPPEKSMLTAKRPRPRKKRNER
jgi:hypothetical protein